MLDYDWPTPKETFVLENEFSLTFKRSIASIPYVDFRYESEINYDKAFDDFYSELVKTYLKFSDPTGHKIGGYPNFTQDDPRGNDKFTDYSTLLFQMDSEYYPKQNIAEIMWGDVGVANFFIKPVNLQKLDFSDVLYTWDCS
ncbi:DUF1963 domain-containing protein [Candidatus Woesebacteria bacterium]|nr:MAG: DUF1963 domain-containing protein [Candidatus Woesebacteria bacterium]